MAVSFSTGTQSYMRSDFMISDAAIPQRLEEALEAEPSENFSQVLSDIGGSSSAASSGISSVGDTYTGKSDATAEQFIDSDGNADFHAIAVAVAEGDLKLEDIPEELFTQELFEEITKLVESPEGDTEQLKPEDADAALEELVALFTAQQTVPAEQLSDKSSEITELAKPAETVQAVTAEQPEQAIQPAQTAEAPAEQIQPEAAMQSGEEVETVQTVVTEQPEKAKSEPKQASTADNAADTAAAQTLTATVTEQPVQQTQTAPAQAKQTAQKSDSDSAAAVDPTAAQTTNQPTITAEQTQQDGGNAQLFSSKAQQASADTAEQTEVADITEFTVKTSDNTAKAEDAQPAQQSPVVTDNTAQRSRVVSKSDELEMIKGSQDSAKGGNTAQLQTQATAQQGDTQTVMFSRSDGTQLEIRPADVTKQVADKLVERSSDLKEGDTEYTLTLEPQDLGKITVRMTKTADGAVSVSIAAENSKTLKIIEENGAHIQDSLRQNGVQLEEWQTVSESRQEMHAEDYRGSSKNPYRENDDEQEEDDSDGVTFAELIASM